MPNKDYTDITMLLDRSGSMQSIKPDIEGGFNAFIEEQRTQPGMCKVTLSQFDTQYENCYTALPLNEVPPLGLHPRGSTALLDAIGLVINETRTRLDAMKPEDLPGVVIIGIMTDGEENSSREMTYEAVKSLINEYEKQHDWIFTYLGANQDAIEEGSKIGIAADRSMTYSPKASKAAMKSYSAVVSRQRKASAAGASRAEMAEAAAYLDEEREASMGE